MKGFEALKHLDQLARVNEDYLGDDDCYEVVEKELKALEIIRKALCKKDDLQLGYYDNDIGKSYYIRIYAQLDNDGEFFEEELTQEEYDLLKEVLL